MEGKKILISQLQDKLDHIDNGPETRVQRADIRIQIEDERRSLISLQTDNDKINYLSCVAKVLIEESNPVKSSEVSQKIVKTQHVGKRGSGNDFQT